jgi:hypothetical protein
MRPSPVPSVGPSRGAAVLSLTDSDMLQNRLIYLLLATTVLALVTVLVYLNPFAI